MSVNKTIIPRRMRDFILGKLLGKTATTAKAVYTSQDPYFEGLGKFIRNPNCWINGLTNISCFSPAQLSGANWRHRAGTLITPKHVIFAKHYAPSIISGGTPLIFVDENNNVVRRKLMQFANLVYRSGPYAGQGTDITVGRLESEVPANIKPAKVLPKDYDDYMDLYAGNPLYMVGLDQEEKALLFRLFSVQHGVGGYSMRVTNFPINDPTHPGFYEEIIPGDSGNPFFFVINNELVLAGCWWNINAGPFVSKSDTYDEINFLLESLSPGEGYSLIDADLAAAYNNMPKMYFNPTVNDNWTTLGNWFQDAALSVPAPYIPAANDIPVLPWDKSAQRVIGGTGVLSGF